MSSEAVRLFAAADLGASSGRVVLGRLAGGRIRLGEIARFDNPLESHGGALRWDFAHLAAAVAEGFESARAVGELSGLGIDTWGVDYGRLDARGVLLERPVSYRDRRTEGAPERMFAHIGPELLYAETGTQIQPFNTLFQLVAASSQDWSGVDRIALMPDLLTSGLTGEVHCEVTNASTTGMLDPRTRRWSSAVVAALRDGFGLDIVRFLPPLVEPGTVAGYSPQGEPVVAVASHDTASAVLALPVERPDFAYVSCGTWSLVGFDLDSPVLSEEARAANFTNELGYSGTVRFLKNVMGLWVLSECRREWARNGRRLPLSQLLAEAARLRPLTHVIDCNDPRLLAPGDMPARVRELAAGYGQDLPDDPVFITRCVLDSLALAYRGAVWAGARIAGLSPRVVHLVGGGSRNALLCQLTASATGLPVIAGPAEGTALGNILVQAAAVGALPPRIETLREVALRSCETTTYQATALGLDAADWDEAAARLELR